MIINGYNLGKCGKKNGKLISTSIVEVKCDHCNKNTWTTQWSNRKKRDHDMCQSCKNRLGISGMKGKKHSIELRKKWSKERSGDKNPAKRPEVREKISKALKGRDAYWLRGIKKPEHSEKMTKFMLRVWNEDGFRNDYRNVLIEKLHSTHSKLHDVIKKWIELNGFEDFESEQTIPSTKLIADELDVNRKIIIEINGDYWHANPKIYNKNDKIQYPGKTIEARFVWSRDIKRRKILESMGYCVIDIWEKDFVENKMNEVKDKLKEKYNE